MRKQRLHEYGFDIGDKASRSTGPGRTSSIKPASDTHPIDAVTVSQGPNVGGYLFSS